jgi:hypothetical protein
MLNNGDPGWILGIPAPSTGPTVVPTATGGPLELTRAYVYTFVSSYGEEGAPSPPTLATGDDDATWNLSNIATAVPNPTERSIAYVNIYRTVTGTLGAVEYYRVTQIPFGTSTYADSQTTEQVSLNPPLESDNWNEPPQGLQGLVVHPNGFLVGFKDKDVYFSLPYRPHAWPVDYILSVEYDIIGLGVFGQSVAILTDSTPSVATGVRPEGMTLTKADSPEPCLSRRGIVSVTAGVFYPGPDGLMLINNNGIQNVTKKFVSRREWQANYNPDAIEAAQYEMQYVAFYDRNAGFIIDMEEPFSVFVELSDYWEHDVMQTDNITGDVWLVDGNIVKKFNPVTGFSVDYVWKSKEFDTPKPLNFGAFRIIYTTNVTAIGPEDVVLYKEFNDARFAAGPLNPINFNVLNGVKTYSLEVTLPENSQPFSKSPLYFIGDTGGGSSLRLRVYANEELIYDQPIDSDLPLRLPTGFRRTRWQIELVGNANVQSFKMAETASELMTI